MRRGGTRTAAGALVAVAGLALAACVPPEAPNIPIPPTGPMTAWWGNGGAFPDPFVMKIGDTYHGWATNYTSWPFHNINYSKAGSGINGWSEPVEAMPQVPDWATNGHTWAPSVLQRGPDDFLLYFAARSKHHGVQCIGVAHSTQPEGPFVDAFGWPLVCQQSLGGAIDPDVFRAPNGNLYLHWKSEGWPVGDQGRIWGQRLTADGLGFVGSSRLMLSPEYAWEGGVLENPAMAHRNGRYWLFYSANDWRTPNYATGLARCDGPIGPCSRVYSTPLLKTGFNFTGPGGLSVVAGAPNLLAFHGWSPIGGGEPHRRLFFVNWSVRGDQVFIP